MARNSFQFQFWASTLDSLGSWNLFAGVVFASELPSARYQIFAFELNWLRFVFIAYCLLAKSNVFLCVSFLGFRCRCRRHCSPAKKYFREQRGVDNRAMDNGHWSLGSGQCSGASEEDRWYSQNTRNANRNSNRLPNALNPHVKCYFPSNRTTEAAKRTRAHDSIVLGH